MHDKGEWHMEIDIIVLIWFLQILTYCYNLGVRSSVRQLTCFNCFFLDKFTCLKLMLNLISSLPIYQMQVNQIGTVTESIQAALDSKAAGWGVMVSHRSGETEDNFIADLSVGLASGQVCTVFSWALLHVFFCLFEHFQKHFIFVLFRSKRELPVEVSGWPSIIR